MSLSQASGIIFSKENCMEAVAPGVCPFLDQTEEQDRVAKLAHALWQSRGCPMGSPEQDWIEAERQLRTAAQLERQLAGRDKET
jgi:hypothetical protein